MGKFEGKTLLVLGSNVGSVELIQYAKSEGAYVIVSDYLPKEKSEAKQYADETAMISTIDVDALCELGRAKKIDGVFCGVSEINLLSVRAVATKLGLPCYFTEAQWDKTENKASFKMLCEEYSVPVAKRYYVNNVDDLQEIRELKYPVVVKPVDQSAGIGVHVCKNVEELIAGYQDAYIKSFSQQVMVEEYLVGLEYTATYTVIDGVYTLSAIYDRYLNNSLVDQIPVTEVHVYPSKYIKQYLEKVDPYLISMMKSIGFSNGSFFVQGIATETSAYVFEAGLRLAGSGTYRLIDHVNGINMLHAMTEYALLGYTTVESVKDDVFFKGKTCCTMNILCRAGTIGTIQGVQEANDVQGVVNSTVVYRERDTIPEGVPIKYIFMRLYIVTDTVEQMYQSIFDIRQVIRVLDENGESMLLEPLDPATYLSI